MYLYKIYGVIFAMSCFLLVGMDAYPTINIRRFFDTAVEGIYKKSDITFPQIDEDVLELEHLKRNPDEVTDDTSLQLKQHDEHTYDKQDKASDVEMPLAVELAETDSISQSDTLPELEKQLESVTTSTSFVATPTKSPVDTIVGHSEQEHGEGGIQGGHRPPMLPHNDGGKTLNNNHQQVESPSGADVTAGVPSMAKPFYGAARLAFGQNPEVLPTSSTTSTSTMTPTTTTTSTATSNAPVSSLNKNSEEREYIKPHPNVEDIALSEISTAKHPILHPLRPSHLDEPKIVDIENTQAANNRETSSDVILDGLEDIKTAERRSVPYLMAPKTAESLLKHDGQYSAFDMAQYVFWTGDEVGVARAVEEFIEQGLMNRENALKFLREIRTGIEYLQRSYSRRPFPEEILQNNVKKSFPPPGTTTSSTTTSTTTTTTDKPFPDTHFDDDLENQRNHIHLQKTIDSISMWNKLQEMNNDERQELSDYDETAGRAKIAEFLYKEYTLEEILYNLAKVMFAQSLSRGSGEAHHELQKLTDFLEREGNRGVIPLDLQKKVLHVLLTALSDTLSEHPELLPAARINLGTSINNIPMRNYGAFN